jgi:LPXTG-motif cell wall-anchored protein
MYNDEHYSGSGSVPYSRTVLATVAFLLVFVLVSAFSASVQRTAGAQQTTTPAVHNGKIAFAGIHPEDADTTNNWDIYTVNADGSGLVKITNTPAIDVDPAWSPDGKKIAFMSNRANSLDIFIMDADGGNVRRLTNNGRANFGPSWSPDGTKIAFAGTPPEPGGNTGTKDEIYTIDVDGTGEKALTNNNTSDGSPDWSPDGRRIAYQGNSGIYIMNSNGTQQRRIVLGSGDPTWSPDGKKILFVGGDGIDTVNPDGSGQTLITNPPDLSEFEPDWQPLAGADTVDANNNVADRGPGGPTGNAGDGTGADGTNEPGGANDAADVINATTSERQLPNTGGAAILAPAIGLLLISGAVTRLVVRRR